MASLVLGPAKVQRVDADDRLVAAGQIRGGADVASSAGVTAQPTEEATREGRPGREAKTAVHVRPWCSVYTTLSHLFDRGFFQGDLVIMLDP